MRKSILKVVHESAKNLHKAGLIDKSTMREFNAKCLPSIKMMPMSKKDKCERGSTNVFKDLGFKDAEEMQAKAILASRIISIIEQEKWNQQEAAKKLELTQPKISLLCRGQLSGFSLGKLIGLLNKWSVGNKN